MKESIQQSGSEVSIVIYDAPLPPRYLRFSKKFIRTLFIVVPVTLGLIFLALLLIGIGTRAKETPVPSMPNVISSDDAKIQGLETEINSLKESNKQLQDRLSSVGSEVATGAPAQEEPFLMGIKKPYGMQNLISENKVTLDQFDLVLENNKTTFKFQIISTNPETRVTGHVLVFMVSDNGLAAYPLEANQAIAGGVKFSMGEPFAVSRLRPTNAEFNQKAVGDTIKFIIYIFSREGDLLLIRETEDYKMGRKS